MDNQNKDNQNDEYKSVDGEIWGTKEEAEQANKAWYDAIMSNGELFNEEEQPKTRK